MALNIIEIFKSLQGETSMSGFPSVFIRLAGCNLRCSYCDTTYSYGKGENIPIDNIIRTVEAMEPFHHITITGGEPLLQEETPVLVKKLISLKYRVRIETNGSFDISSVPPPVERILDIKPPSSGEEGSFFMGNIDQLAKADEVKFIVADENDFMFAKKFFDENLKKTAAVINISPVEGAISHAECARLILESGINARLNLQIHKIVWPRGEPK